MFETNSIIRCSSMGYKTVFWGLLFLVLLLPPKLSSAQIGISPIEVAPLESCDAYTFTYNLYYGRSDRNTDGEVSKLQRLLRKTGDFTYPEITGFYGLVTIQAVRKFQERNGIASSGDLGYGYVGPKTREALLALCLVQSVGLRVLEAGDTYLTAPNVQAFTFTTYELDSSDVSESVRISQLKLAYTSNAPTFIENCRLFNDRGTTLSSGFNTVNPTAPSNAITFTMDTPLIIPSAESVLVTIRCDIGKSAKSGYEFSWGYNSDAQMTAMGLDTANSYNVVGKSAFGRKIIVEASSEEPLVSVSSAVGGTLLIQRGVTQALAVMSVKVRNEPVLVTRDGTLTFNFDIAGGKPSDVHNFELWDLNSNRIVAGPVDINTDNPFTFTFSDPFTFAEGANLYEIRGIVRESVADTGFVTLYTYPENQWLGLLGQESGVKPIFADQKVGFAKLTFSSSPSGELPDLAILKDVGVSEIEWDIDAGESQIVSVQIENIGGDVPPGQNSIFEVGLSINQSGGEKVYGSGLRKITVPQGGGGATSIKFPIPAKDVNIGLPGNTFLPGKYEIVVYVDEKNRIVESNENNNTSKAIFTVPGVNVAPEITAVEYFNTPTLTIAPGQEVLFRWSAQDKNFDNLCWWIFWGDYTKPTLEHCREKWDSSETSFSQFSKFKASHAWTKEGTYGVIAYVRDPDDAYDIHITLVDVVEASIKNIDLGFRSSWRSQLANALQLTKVLLRGLFE